MANLTSAPPYLGDYKEDDTLSFLWDSFDRNGSSITRSTDGTVEVYKDGGLTQSTAGITDTEDFDGVTGRHLCQIDLSADAFYAAAGDYSIVLTGAVIDTRTVNCTIAHFSIENRAPILAIGAPVALDSGTASIAGMLTKMADDNGGADFDATTDSLEKIYSSLAGIGGIVIRTGTCQAGSTATTIKLDAGASATDDIYEHTVVAITGGTGVGQTRIIHNYTGSTKVAEIAHSWHITPDNTSTFSITPGVTHTETMQYELDRGVAQAGSTATTIKLDAGASAVDDYYNGQLVNIHDDTGEMQCRIITDYDGTTKVANIAPNWATNPDNTSQYAIYPAYVDIKAGMIDTVTVETILTEMLARTSGKYTVDDPTTGDITFKKRDNSTTSHVVNVTTAGRTRS